ncbi:MAG: AmmeMemoRadiSam system protein B [archaeon]
MVREPIVAGMFYEDNAEELEKQISECFSHKFGPGAIPEKKDNKKIMAIIAPHAGYVYSGPCAAWSFKEIAESYIPDLFILIGLSHSGYGSCVSLQDWKTPLGTLKNDQEFTRVLIANSQLKANENAHSKEHSIEVQLPFLQFVNKDNIDKIKITPVIASPNINYKEIAESIKKTIKQTRKKVCIIASSDFTHYGVSYGYLPFVRNVKENLYKLDKDGIDFIEKLNPEGFLNYVNETGATVCGYYGIATLLHLCKLLNASEASLLKYYTSGDIVNDYSNAVGYASIVIK